MKRYCHITLSLILSATICTPGFAISEPIQPLPEVTDVDPKKVSLGRKLFHDKRLSKDDSVSCASCHNISQGGVDGLAHSVGVDNQIGGINAPTVLNSRFNFVQFWDGRAKDLEEQAAGPVTNPIEMGGNWDVIINKLNQDIAYQQSFKELYQDTAKKEHITNAIAEYERSLVTINSPFDQYLKGDQDAISAQQKNGYALFKSKGCIACHMGPNVGGTMYQKMGLVKNYFQGKDTLTDADLGRFNVTKKDSDKHFFKVPTLRNIALTAPYFHDGSVKTLKEAVIKMSEYQLGLPLSDAQADDIVAFLESLTATIELQEEELKEAS